MPRCPLCDEWTGPGVDVHDYCLNEFQRQMRKPGLLRRMLRRMWEVLETLIALTIRTTRGLD